MRLSLLRPLTCIPLSLRALIPRRLCWAWFQGFGPRKTYIMRASPNMIPKPSLPTHSGLELSTGSIAGNRNLTCGSMLVPCRRDALSRSLWWPRTLLLPPMRKSLRLPFGLVFTDRREAFDTPWRTPILVNLHQLISCPASWLIADELLQSAHMSIVKGGSRCLCSNFP